MWALRIVFLAAVVCAASRILYHCRWEGYYNSGSGTWIIHLETTPVWSPPPTPTYDQFRAAFDDLPQDQLRGTSISRILKWDWMVLDFLLYFWGITTTISVVYLCGRSKRQDFGLHIAL